MAKLMVWRWTNTLIPKDWNVTAVVDKAAASKQLKEWKDLAKSKGQLPVGGDIEAYIIDGETVTADP